MEKSKLISILKRSYNDDFKNYSPTDCFMFFKENFLFKMYSERMDAKDIIISSFMLPHMGKKIVFSTLYDEIFNNLFAFSLFEITNDVGEEKCENCDGDGTFECEECSGLGKEACPECGGDGEVDCPECGGDGRDYSDSKCSACHGRGVINCYDCDGEGDIDCTYCSGEAYWTCAKCGGDGEIEDDSKSQITQYYFASYDSRIMQVIYPKEKLSIFYERFIDHLFSNKKTLLFRKIDTNTETEWDKGTTGDYLFSDISENPEFFKYGSENKIDVRGIADL